MGKFVNKRHYERFVLSLKGPLESLNGEIYETYAETLDMFGCSMNIVIRETQVQPDVIFRLLTEIAEKFKPMYDEYMDEQSSGMDNTMVRIRKLIFTGGLEGLIGINLNDSSTTVLPVERLQWTKEVRFIKNMMKYLEDPAGFRNVMELDDTTLERLNRGLKQLQSQKNVQHNLHIHLDFIEEGTFKVEGKDIYYKFPEDIKLKFECEPTKHNKITGLVDFNWKPIYVEYPISRENGLIMEDTLIDLVTTKIKQILKSNDLVPHNFSSNSANKDRMLFNVKFKFIG